MNDRLRKMLDHSKDGKTATKRSLIWGMFMSSTLEASLFMGKNHSEHFHSVENTGKDLTLKQMFDISEKLVVRQSEEIFGVTPINWEDSRSVMKKTSVSRTRRFIHFQILGGALEM